MSKVEYPKTEKRHKIHVWGLQERAGDKRNYNLHRVLHMQTLFNYWAFQMSLEKFWSLGVCVFLNYWMHGETFT